LRRRLMIPCFEGSSCFFMVLGRVLVMFCLHFGETSGLSRFSLSHGERIRQVKRRLSCLYRDAPFEYKKGETWDRLVHQGVHLLERFAQDNRIRIPQPKENLEIQVMREFPDGNDFVSFVDTIGERDGVHCLIDWKTTTSRYSEAPAGLPSLDPQLICYSWMTGISDVAFVVFVRKHQPEIQYLKTSITEEQRLEFGRLVETTISQITSAQFPSHSGIRFPQNGCVSCSHLGLCLDDQKLINSKLIRTPGAHDLAWLDELVD
jgi:hypothetical protein